MNLENKFNPLVKKEILQFKTNQFRFCFLHAPYFTFAQACLHRLKISHKHFTLISDVA